MKRARAPRHGDRWTAAEDRRLSRMNEKMRAKTPRGLRYLLSWQLGRIFKRSPYAVSARLGVLAALRLHRIGPAS